MVSPRSAQWVGATAGELESDMVKYELENGAKNL